MLQQEAFKLLWKQGVLWVLIAALAGQWLLFHRAQDPYMLDVTRYRTQILEYLEPVRGQWTPDTRTLLDREGQKFDDARTRIGQIQQQYQSGQTDLLTFHETISAQQSILDREPAWRWVSELADYAAQDPANRQLLYTPGWHQLLFPERLDILPLLGVLVLCAPLFTREREHGMPALLQTGRRGRSRVPMVKLMLAVSVTLVLVLCGAILQYADCVWRFGLPTPSAPVQSLEAFADLPENLSFRGAWMQMTLHRCLAAVLFASVVACLSAFSHHTLSVLIAGLGLILLPFFASGSSGWMYHVPGPVGPWVAVGYYRDVQPEALRTAEALIRAGSRAHRTLLAGNLLLIGAGISAALWRMHHVAGSRKGAAKL